MLFYLQGLNFCIFVLVFSERENECNIGYIFDPQMYVIMIFLLGTGCKGFDMILFKVMELIMFDDISDHFQSHLVGWYC